MTNTYAQAPDHAGSDTAARIQAHLGQPSKFANGKTRNWSLFVFFRILSKTEMETSRALFARLAKEVLSSKPAKRGSAGATDYGSELASPHLARSAMPGAAAPGAEAAALPEDPLAENLACDEFRAWLKLLSTGDHGELLKQLDGFLQLDARKAPSAKIMKLVSTFAGALRKGNGIFGAIELAQKKFSRGLGNERDLVAVILALTVFLKSRDPRIRRAVARIFDLSAFGKDAGEAGVNVVSHRLVALCAYELLRQTKLARDSAAEAGDASPVRNERAEAGSAAHADGEGLKKQVFDPVPVNIAFTFPGLEKLNIDANTLRSFPDVFKEGMAARAKRLGDTGASAPENWDGELGLKNVHGYFTGGFQVGDVIGGGKWDMGPEESWEALRRDIDDFNHRNGERGKALRTMLGGLFRFLGMEIVHIELGQDPYSVENGRAVTSGYRKEHFGFRDGISQPFVDMKLGKPMPGGATPGPNGTWAPVAPGEIYLGFPDEDGNYARQPANKVLRDGATFVVFRKLEQDVAGFRDFLEKQRPGDAQAQTKLAAQFMGRWHNGTPLVLQPDSPRPLGPESDRKINDFLFVRDDPNGDRCPLGSHVRRTNPRDIGGRNDVRRHRILRRGIGYGGPLMADGSRGDGKKRGLLFIAANARLDLQFEVIQADWMNGGEFLGQAGLDRCPVAGTNSGGLEDRFHESGAAVPITHIPSFVTTRGGDYFFAPSKEAIAGMASRDRFELDPSELLSQGHSMSDPETPGLFTETRIRGFVGRFLKDKRVSLIRAKLPDIPTDSPYNDGTTLHEPSGLDHPVCFVGRHGDVADVLKLVDDKGDGRFSVDHYSLAGRRVLRGDDMLIGTAQFPADSGKRRKLLYTILMEAWKALDAAHRAGNAGTGVRGRLEDIVSTRIEMALARTGDSHRIDLVRDLASDVSYAVLKDLLGTPGPAWITELGISLPFARQHVGHLHPDWLSVSKGKMPQDPGLATMQIWSILTLGDVFGNVLSYKTLMHLSEQAGAELLNHLNRLIMDAWSARPSRTRTLVDAFIAIEDQMLRDNKGYTRAQYHADVAAILFELIASTMAAIPSTFGNIMDTLLTFRISLPSLFDLIRKQGLEPDGADKCGYSLATQIIYESERLQPNFKLLMRRCVKGTQLESGARLDAGEWVAALIPAANLDGSVFDDPYRFSLYPFVQEHPQRSLEKYLLFGSATNSVGTDVDARVGARHCWGRDAIALYILERCLLAAGRLEGLRKVAGEAGEMQEIAKAATGLWGRFNQLRPR
ncbi:hypothetical protein [Hoeflea poritis]|uniref:DyP dimeric alpha+beta barrel domain-containing protein n=1 Tax=Hoeflea poritis TaxID=2993659 RepID=A0ABT4VL43_9HYPH|nr:hypothetical protein [Hoeflea poritis]MDA4845434.1 hypothetical protein [Hoeflea poritis]